MSQPQQRAAINYGAFSSFNAGIDGLVKHPHELCCSEAGHTPNPARPRQHQILRAVFRTKDGTGREVLTNRSEQCGVCLLVSTQIPVPSQQMILIRVCRRLLNTNRAPCFGSSPSRSVTSAWRPLKPLRMSQASTATNTFKLPEKLNMAWLMPAPGLPPAPPAFRPPLPGASRRATAIPTGSQPPPLGRMQRPLPIAGAGVAAPSLWRDDYVAPSWPAWNTLIRSAAQTGAATHRCGPTPQECPAVEPSTPAADLWGPSAQAPSA